MNIYLLREMCMLFLPSGYLTCCDSMICVCLLVIIKQLVLTILFSLTSEHKFPHCTQQDINPWLQFGHEGYTTPPATAHKGSCTYSPEHVMCPIPDDCTSRMPRVPSKGSDMSGTHFFLLSYTIVVYLQFGFAAASAVLRKHTTSLMYYILPCNRIGGV